jgi:hypothetical protein
MKTKKGIRSLKGTGKRLVNNFVENVNYIADSSVEITTGILEKDKSRVVKSAKKLVKWAAVGAITVGVVKMADSEEPSESDGFDEK